MRKVKNEQAPLCACGCGKKLKKTKKGKYLTYINGHQRRMPLNKLIYQDDKITKFLVESPKYGDFEIIVDTEDWERINQYRWYLSYRKEIDSHYIRNTKNKTYLHRFILNIKNKFIFIDHKNHNTLDNRKTNIRRCNTSENNMNKKGNRNSSSKYKGVSFSNSLKKFTADINYNESHVCIGRFKYEVNAAKAYNEKAKELYGEFAHLNDLSNIKEFPEESEKKYSSEYRGVYFRKDTKKFSVMITINKKKIRLGCFNDEIYAAKIYNKAVLKYLGDKAILNDV